jgi:hypothetical protein
VIKEEENNYFDDSTNPFSDEFKDDSQKTTKTNAKFNDE